MKIKIETLITKDSTFQASSSKVFNQLFAESSSKDFTANSFDVKEFSISSDEKNLFELKLSSIIQDFSKVSSITAFCNSTPKNTKELIKPVRFTTQINETSIISSQFAIYDIQDMFLNDIVFNTFDIKEDNSVIFTLAISFK